MTAADTQERRSRSDYVFDTLFDRIVSLELLPGTKLSETEVAKSFGVSRQPIREAFTRLAGLNLLLIRPQRATLVRPFSKELISNARFVRKAIELEIIRDLAVSRDETFDAKLKSNMRQQKDAIADKDAQAFHELDYEFHKLLCLASGKAFAFDIISANKAQIDRLCMLSLTSEDAMRALYADHDALLEALFSGDADTGAKVLNTHLGRLTPMIDALYTTHRDYFE